MKAVKLNETTNKRLDEISSARKEADDIVRTKRGIIEQLIEAAYKKECK